MEQNPLSHDASLTPSPRDGERRKNPRFGMTFPVILRAIGDPWTASKSANLSKNGAFILCDRPYMLNAPVEYVLTFPPELTKASHPLLVRFFGMVLRCERAQDGSGLFGIAVRNTAHRYLTKEEAASFHAIQREVLPPEENSAEPEAES